MDSKSLKNKICLITGTGKGIGRAVAEKFAKEGAIVYANDLEEGTNDKWSDDLNKKLKTEIHPLYFDVTDFDSTRKAIMQIKKQHQKIDILVNNAGIVTYELLGLAKMDNLKKMFDVNVAAVIHLIQLASRLMSRQKSGSIINISSIVGTRGVKGQLTYAATKGAINAVTKSAAKELAEMNIRVNAIAPGMVNTERLRNVMEKSFSSRIEDIGMKRLADAEEIADACLFFASDSSKYITGQILEVDGSTRL